MQEEDVELSLKVLIVGNGPCPQPAQAAPIVLYTWQIGRGGDVPVSLCTCCVLVFLCGGGGHGVQPCHFLSKGVSVSLHTHCSPSLSLVLSLSLHVRVTL